MSKSVGHETDHESEKDQPNFLGWNFFTYFIYHIQWSRINTDRQVEKTEIQNFFFLSNFSLISYLIYSHILPVFRITAKKETFCILPPPPPSEVENIGKLVRICILDIILFILIWWMRSNLWLHVSCFEFF